MKYVVTTGGSGYLGQKVTQELLQEGYHVVSLGRKQKKVRQKNFTHIYWSLGDDFPNKQVAEITKSGSVAAIIHLAHQWDDCSGNNSFNLQSTKTLYQTAIKACGDRFIFASSISASKFAKNRYGRIKWDIENQLASEQFYSARIGLVYGGPLKSQWGMLCNLIKRFRILPMIKAKQLVQPIHINEVAKAITNMVSVKNTKEKYFVLASDKPITFRTFLSKISRICYGRSIIVISVPHQPILYLTNALNSFSFFSRIQEKIQGLLGLPVLCTKTTKLALNFAVGDIESNLKSEKLTHKQLLYESLVVLRAVIYKKPSISAMKAYVRAIKLYHLGTPMCIQPFTILSSSFIRIFEPLRRSTGDGVYTNKLTKRIYLAGLIAEASDLAPKIYKYEKRNIFSIYLRIILLVFIEIFIIPMRLLSTLFGKDYG